MSDFKIRRGLSTALFSEPGVVNPRLVIEEGCWYLCTDTAELYLGVLSDNGELTLKQINGRNVANIPTTGPVGGELEEVVELFVRISNESELPTEFDLPDFNPNVTYYIPILNPDGTLVGRTSTYIFDKETQSYFCTNSVDDFVIRSMVSEAIDELLDESLMATQLPKVVKQTIEATILNGGDATPEDD
jgi:hypothetical protein